MLKLSKEEIEFIKVNFEDYESLLKSDSLDDILLPLDALITEKGFDDNYDLNVFGRKAQRIYDNIFYNN